MPLPCLEGSQLLGCVAHLLADHLLADLAMGGLPKEERLPRRPSQEGPSGDNKHTCHIKCPKGLPSCSMSILMLAAAPSQTDTGSGLLGLPLRELLGQEPRKH